jgi:hypothetical protein
VRGAEQWAELALGAAACAGGVALGNAGGGCGGASWGQAVAVLSVARAGLELGIVQV